MRIHITGNMATGKSTLATALGEYLQVRPVLEANVVENNPYWKDFCQLPERWAFHLQIYFLRSTLFAQSQASANVIFDFCASACLPFTAAMCGMGWLTSRDYKEYVALFELAAQSAIRPDLHVFLFASPSTLAQRIRERQRPGETSLAREYTELLCQQWIEERIAVMDRPAYSRVLFVDTDAHDTRADTVVRSIGAQAKALINSGRRFATFGVD